MLLSEPQVTVRPRRDLSRAAARGGNGELADDTGGSDLPDLVPVDLSELEVAVGARRDPPGWLFDVGIMNSVTVVVAADTTHGSPAIAETSSKRWPHARTNT